MKLINIKLAPQWFLSSYSTGTASSNPSVCTRHLFHHVTIAHWRGNTSPWLHCHPALPPSLDGLHGLTSTPLCFLHIFISVCENLPEKS